MSPERTRWAGAVLVGAALVVAVALVWPQPRGDGAAAAYAQGRAREVAVAGREHIAAGGDGDVAHDPQALVDVALRSATAPPVGVGQAVVRAVAGGVEVEVDAGGEVVTSWVCQPALEVSDRPCTAP